MTLGGIYDARHHVIVTWDRSDQRILRDCFAARVRVVEGDDWSQIGERLGRLGLWEFEDYTAEGRPPDPRVSQWGLASRHRPE
ncbi:hypothetical protein IF188_17490 [Microbacterium sp. NEAU-LLC]|uniref:Uncharacterized protein n=2 Tax=Microbacterium helvum TaxID=2773713 RepID=A0ABR8NS64_9MICO|nr:hypothetical protein [Microbacterium helvum]